jgi:hypothetical protein
MSERIHALTQLVLGKPSLKDCDLHEIRAVANRYPYFAPAQFLLLEKLKEEEAPGYDQQLQKAVLYYHNPLAFEYFISADRFKTDFNESEIIKEEVSPVPQAPVHDQNVVAFEEPSLEQVDIEPKNERTEEVVNTPVDEVVQEETTGQPVQTETLVTTAPVLTFEPFHTVDYFASLGIKLVQEELPKDKLGKQLKSFTEWLKTMKKLPSAAVPSPIDASSESKVQHLAEDSVHDADVVTEAMAEVWIKQGNIKKALEVYNKLVLHNPSKRAYFAAKIENLKRS